MNKEKNIINPNKVKSTSKKIIKIIKRNDPIKSNLLKENQRSSELCRTAKNDRFYCSVHNFSKTTYKKWEKKIGGNFPELVLGARIALATIFQMLIKDISNPFAIIFVGAPSSGKTITINFFDGIDDLTYATDKFTPASFVSNASNVKRERLKSIDLLPRIRYKMLLIRDMATVFSKKEDELRDSFGLLTRALDGEGVSTDSGVHGSRQYRGDYLFMLLGASTPITKKVWSIMGNQGHRLFFYNIRTKEKSEEDLVNQISTKTSYKEKELECREATKNLLYTEWNKNKNGIKWNKENDDLEIKLIIARCAKLLSRLRGFISFEDNTYKATIENPDRLNQWLYNFCRGSAISQGRRKIEKEDLLLMIRLVLDSFPVERRRFFYVLIKNKGILTTQIVEQKLKVKGKKALQEIEKFKKLKVVKEINNENRNSKPMKKVSLSKDLDWFIGDEFMRLHVEAWENRLEK